MDELNINGIEISKQNYKDIIHYSFRPDLLSYIETINILYKTHVDGFITKTLEFGCTEISESVFKDFIAVMHSVGFKSTRCIQYFQMNKIIYNYDFTTALSAECKYRLNKKNKSTYKTSILYKN